MENKKNVNYLQKEEFDKFYQKVINVVMDAKSNPGKKNVTLEQLFNESNLVFDVDEKIIDTVKIAMRTNLYAPVQQSSNPCPACSVCYICALCAGGNAASAVLAVANVSKIFDSAITINSNEI
ncbi:MAG: hypothetical protein IJZ87_04000 [Bacteroidales bacterium]|nr:hypothetical protein [Bacteroidales bacterium]